MNCSGPNASEWDVAPPVLFNPWKHHAAFLRHRIGEAARGGEPGLAALAAALAVTGGELMDLYLGALSPRAIAGHVTARLRGDDLLEFDAYRAWLAEGAGYRVLALPDESSWVLRLGDVRDRPVHVHPGRWSSATRRVRANVLKTAVMALAVAAARRGDPLDHTLIDQGRRDYLGLPPVGPRRAGAEGLAGVIASLRPPPKIT